MKQEKDLEKKFFRYSSFYTSLVSVFSLIINLLSNLGITLYVLPSISVIFFYLCFYFSKFDRFYNYIKFAFFMGFIVLLDFFYLFNGGLDSSIPYIFIIAFLMINLVIKRKFKNQFIIYIMFLANLFLMYYIEKSYPSLITPYPTLEAKESDLIGSFGMVSFLIAIIINFFKSTYEKLLNDIAIKNQELVLSEKVAKEEKEKAEKANNAKRDFLSVMSHEIRTPLNAIISIIHLLESNGENRNTSQDESFIKTLKYSSDNLLALVSNILDFTRIDAGEVKLEETNFNLKNILESLLLVYKPQAIEKNNTLNINFKGFDKYDFFGDSLRLTQVIINLISNAIKFTENGTIDLNVHLLESTSDINKIYFEIIDTGIGISEEKREDIFEKFTQENVSITRKYGGSGLGLSITKKLIELMNSNIKLESQIGKGSKFFFVLDLKSAQYQKNDEMKTQNIEMSPLKILLVEDNKVNIAVTTKFFDRWNMSYDVAENGLIAVNKFEKNDYNLILMDLQMPEMDGFTATQMIRETDKNIPIIALTANSMAEEKERCLSSGFDEYITKPFKPDILKESIYHFYNKNNTSENNN